MVMTVVRMKRVYHALDGGGLPTLGDDCIREHNARGTVGAASVGAYATTKLTALQSPVNSTRTNIYHSSIK